LIERSLNLLWYSTAEASTIVRYSDETIDLMSRSGCVSLMIGGETACLETMKLINKNIKPGQVEAVIKRLQKRNISSFVNYIIGYPDETTESIEQTIEECIYLRSKYPKTYAGISGFIPLPGSAFYTKALNLGYQEPKFPEDYEKIDGIHVHRIRNWNSSKLNYALSFPAFLRPFSPIHWPPIIKTILRHF